MHTCVDTQIQNASCVQSVARHSNQQVCTHNQIQSSQYKTAKSVTQKEIKQQHIALQCSLVKSLSVFIPCYGGEPPPPTLTTFVNCKLDMFNLLTGGVKEHLVTHTGELKYSCPHCPKEFARPRELKNHVAFHTGNLPHKCSICAKAYPLQCQLDVSVQVAQQQVT